MVPLLRQHQCDHLPCTDQLLRRAACGRPAGEPSPGQPAALEGRLFDEPSRWSAANIGSCFSRRREGACANVSHRIGQFLNKCDLLEKKLSRGVRVVDYVPTYGSKPNDLESVTRCQSRRVRSSPSLDKLTLGPCRLPLAVQGYLCPTFTQTARLLLVSHVCCGTSFPSLRLISGVSMSTYWCHLLLFCAHWLPRI